MEARILGKILSLQPDTGVHTLTISYIIGGILALLILGYLVYTLLRPEKF